MRFRKVSNESRSVFTLRKAFVPTVRACQPYSPICNHAVDKWKLQLAALEMTECHEHFHWALRANVVNKEIHDEAISSWSINMFWRREQPILSRSVVSLLPRTWSLESGSPSFKHTPVFVVHAICPHLHENWFMSPRKQGGTDSSNFNFPHCSLVIYSMIQFDIEITTSR